jgi:hypothetical protein
MSHLDSSTTVPSFIESLSSLSSTAPTASPSIKSTSALPLSIPKIPLQQGSVQLVSIQKDLDELQVLYQTMMGKVEHEITLISEHKDWIESQRLSIRMPEDSPELQSLWIKALQTRQNDMDQTLSTLQSLKAVIVPQSSRTQSIKSKLWPRFCMTQAPKNLEKLPST